jgi:hypothetical protein
MGCQSVGKYYATITRLKAARKNRGFPANNSRFCRADGPLVASLPVLGPYCALTVSVDY